MIKVLPGYTAI